MTETPQVLSQAKLKQIRDEMKTRGINWILDLFLRELPNYLNNLKEAIANGDGQGLYLAAHKFKGSCSNVGAEGIVALCKQLETLGHANELQTASQLIENELEQEIKRLEQAIFQEKEKEKAN
jgi:HPt (histidine-containing phosphotransfer) domain-containing protein